MKTSLFIPVIVLAIGLSGFSKQIISTPSIPSISIKKATALPGDGYCSIYTIGSLTKNGQEIGSAYTGYLFYFCSDMSFSIYTDNWVVNGTWIMAEKNGSMVINVSVPQELEWINGEWQILYQDDYLLEMEHVVNGDSWRVRFERRQR